MCGEGVGVAVSVAGYVKVYQLPQQHPGEKSLGWPTSYLRPHLPQEPRILSWGGGGGGGREEGGRRELKEEGEVMRNMMRREEMRYDREGKGGIGGRREEK